MQAGQHIGRGVVIDPEISIQLPSGRRRAAKLRCDCGNEYIAALLALVERNGKINTTSCGCAQKEFAAELGHTFGPRSRTHGLTEHALWQAWADMLRRCENPDANGYANWGGRGIRVCERWHDLALFIQDIEAAIGPRPDGHSFDRVDNEGDYEPGNVRWADPVTQNRNRRGRKLTMAQADEIRARYAAGGTSHTALAREFGVSPATVTAILSDKLWRH